MRGFSVQVFDLDQEAPEKSLQRIYANLERLKHKGDDFASKFEQKLKIIVSLVYFSSNFLKIYRDQEKKIHFFLSEK